MERRHHSPIKGIRWQTKNNFFKLINLNSTINIIIYLNNKLLQFEIYQKECLKFIAEVFYKQFFIAY